MNGIKSKPGGMHKVLNETVRDLETFHPKSRSPLCDALDFILFAFIMYVVHGCILVKDLGNT